MTGSGRIGVGSVVFAGVCAVVLLCGGARAQGEHFNVRALGAAGDGTSLDTQAIQGAIDAAGEAGGGTVFFPAGKYLTGTIYLRDNVRLDLDAGARILGSPNLADYPIQANGFPSRADRYSMRALIRGEGLKNIAITGCGTIDGQGPLFRDNVASPETIAAMVEEYGGADRYVPNPSFVDRPFLIQFVSCTQVRVEGVRLRFSAMWMQHYLNCDFVMIRGIDVFNHGCRNNDMMDIDCCRNVTISDCIGDSDDDALTLKSTAEYPTEHVAISNCILRSHCNALKAGTESAGGFRDIAISNCVIQRSAATEVLAGRAEGLAGIALEIVDGGVMERVAISNVVIEGTSAPLFLRLGNRARPGMPSAAKPGVGTFREVSISNVIATGAGNVGCAITGLPGHPLQDIRLSNICIRFAGGGSRTPLADVQELPGEYPECTMFGALPAYGFYVRHAEGIHLRDVELYCETAEERPMLVCDDVRGLRMDGLRGTEGPDLQKVVLSGVEDAFIDGHPVGE